MPQAVETHENHEIAGFAESFYVVDRHLAENDHVPFGFRCKLRLDEVALVGVDSHGARCPRTGSY